MKNNLKEKYGDWALITGATSGIGAELTSQIAAKGINIVLVARKENDLIKHAESLQKRYGVQTLTIAADLATPEGVQKVKQIDESISLLVLAAGLEVNGAFEKNSLENELKVIQLNVVATMELTHHFCKSMVEKKKGGILLIASLSGHMPNPYFANYAGSKAFVLNFGASLYGELKPKGVDISVLSPGLTKTPMTADNGIDWSKTPMSAMDPSMVAEAGLNGLGNKFLIVPGGKNKMMAWMAKHMPLEMQAKMNEKMVWKAIDKSKV
ncbi:MAG: short-subunit dehydrogenase [Marinoscillum sp.]|jgi:short-subunit dehydrogenase